MGRENVNTERRNMRYRKYKQGCARGKQCVRQDFPRKGRISLPKRRSTTSRWCNLTLVSCIAAIPSKLENPYRERQKEKGKLTPKLVNTHATREIQTPKSPRTTLILLPRVLKQTSHLISTLLFSLLLALLLPYSTLDMHLPHMLVSLVFPASKPLLPTLLPIPSASRPRTKELLVIGGMLLGVVAAEISEATEGHGGAGWGGAAEGFGVRENVANDFVGGGGGGGGGRGG